MAVGMILFIANRMGFYLHLSTPIRVLFYIIFSWGFLALHITLGFFIWRDARKRDDLLFDIPAWTWGLMGLVTGIVGLSIHWLANRCKAIKTQTIKPIETQSPEPY